MLPRFRIREKTVIEGERVLPVLCLSFGGLVVVRPLASIRAVLSVETKSEEALAAGRQRAQFEGCEGSSVGELLKYVQHHTGFRCSERSESSLANRLSSEEEQTFPASPIGESELGWKLPLDAPQNLVDLLFERMEAVGRSERVG